MPVKRAAFLLGEVLLAGQPYLAVPLFLNSVFEAPASWLAWILVLLPIIVRCLKERRPGLRTRFDIPILIFMAGVFVGALSSSNQSTSLQLSFSFVACILMYYGFINNSQRSNRYWFFTGAIFFVVVLITAVIYIPAGHGQISMFFNRRGFSTPIMFSEVGGFIADSSILSSVLAPLIPFVLALALSLRLDRERFISILVLTVFAVLLFISGSGGGWLATLVGCTIVLICWRPIRAWWLVPLYAVAILLFVSSYYNFVWLKEALPVFAVTGAVSLWGRALILIQGKLFTGLGFGQWVGAYREAYGATTLNLHSTYVQFVIDFGLIGILSLLFGILSTIKLVRQVLAGSRYDNIWFGVGIGLIGAGATGAIQGIVENSFSVVSIVGGDIYYVALPIIWFWAAMLVVCSNKLTIIRGST